VINFLSEGRKISSGGRRTEQGHVLNLWEAKRQKKVLIKRRGRGDKPN